MNNDEKILAVLKVLANIANQYDRSHLDEERPEWGIMRESEGKSNLHFNQVELLTGRGGGTLLTLQDCFDARETLQEFEALIKQ